MYCILYLQVFIVVLDPALYKLWTTLEADII